MTFGPSNTQGPYLPINQTFSEDDDQFLIQITNRDRDIARYLNIRQIGIYDLNENPTGQQFPGTTPQSKKQTFRKIFQIGPIAPGATSTTAHGITGFTAFTQIYGTAITTVVDYRPIPYTNVSLLSNQISVLCDSINLNVTNGATAPPITSAMIVLEYLKN